MTPHVRTAAMESHNARRILLPRQHRLETQAVIPKKIRARKSVGLPSYAHQFIMCLTNPQCTNGHQRSKVPPVQLSLCHGSTLAADLTILEKRCSGECPCLECQKDGYSCEYDYSRRDRLTQLGSHKQVAVNLLQKLRLTAGDRDQRSIEAVPDEVSEDSY
jgi:hypothetical protein